MLRAHRSQRLQPSLDRALLVGSPQSPSCTGHHAAARPNRLHVIIVTTCGTIIRWPASCTRRYDERLRECHVTWRPLASACSSPCSLSQQRISCRAVCMCSHPAKIQHRPLKCIVSASQSVRMELTIAETRTPLTFVLTSGIGVGRIFAASSFTISSGCSASSHTSCRRHPTHQHISKSNTQNRE